MNRFGQPCYTYLLGWKALDIWYYGFRAANRVSPEDDLMKVYFTNSIYVKKTISEHGPPDIIRVHKLFGTKQEARAFESRFLTRVNAVRSPRWLNKHNGSSDFVPGDIVSATHRQKLSKANTGKKRSEDTKRKMSEKKKAFLATPEGQAHLKKMIEARSGKTVWNKGISTPPYITAKQMETRKKNHPDGYKPSLGRKSSEETKQKIRDAALKRGPVSEEARRLNSERVKAWWAAGRPKGGLEYSVKGKRDRSAGRI